MKQFTSLPGAHKYAENSSRKHSTHRYIIYNGYYWIVQDNNEVNDREKIDAHYFNGEKIEDNK